MRMERETKMGVVTTPDIPSGAVKSVIAMADKDRT